MACVHSDTAVKHVRDSCAYVPQTYAFEGGANGFTVCADLANTNYYWNN
jgi:hypothetical protein